MGEIIDFLAEKEKRKDTRVVRTRPAKKALTGMKRAAIEARIAGENNIVALAQLFGTIGYVATDGGAKTSDESLDMLCDILFGCTHHELLLYYKERLNQ